MAYVTDLAVSTCEEEEGSLQALKFTKIFVNINEGTKAKKKVFLWFKKGDDKPITRVQVTFNDEMETAMDKKEFKKIVGNLNSGTGGKPIYMWYSTVRKNYDIPIVDVAVTQDPSQEAQKLMPGSVWEAVCCDLNLGASSETCVYAWFKRENPFFISKVTATVGFDLHHQLLSEGNTRVDVNTNQGAGGSPAFIWYFKTTNPNESLSFLGISTNDDEFQILEEQGFEVVKKNLNTGTGGNPVYLWTKKVDLEKLKGIFLLCKVEAVGIYKDAGIQVIERNLNTGNPGATLYTCFVG